MVRVKKTVRIVLVEDSPDDVQLLLRHLRSGGYDPVYKQVYTAAGMREALLSDTWDAIIADYIVPGFGALPALHVLHDLGLDIPFIVVSGVVGEESAVAAMRAGAHDYVRKDNLCRLIPALEREMREVQERKQTEAALWESEERYRSLVQATSQIIWSADADGLAQVESLEWLRYTGQTAKEYLGLGWLDAIHPADRERVRQTWMEAVRSGTTYMAEYRLRSRENEYRYFVARGAPIRDRAGRVREWLGTCTDIHVQKEAEQSLRAANEAKDQFLATLSHELRNPLAAIATATEVLRATPQTDPAAQRAIEILRRNIEIQTRLVDDLLDLSRITLGKMRILFQHIRLDETVRRVVEQILPKARMHGLTVCLESLPEAWVKGDTTRIEQVLFNLLDNAVKFTPSGGRIIVSLEADADMLRLAVEDTGVGFSREKAETLFDLFKQGKAAEQHRSGLGIGLALVKRLVELHGGQVHAESDGLGKGSRFVVELPTVPPPGFEVNGCSQSGGKRAQNFHVLLVDDNRDFLVVLQEMLEMSGFAVTVAGRAEEALKVLADGQIDLIVTDLCLPDKDGRTWIREARQSPKCKDIPALALTGVGDRFTQTEKDNDFAGYLLKPVGMEELLAAIESIASERQE